MAHSQPKPLNPETIQANPRTKSRAGKTKPVSVALCEIECKQVVAASDVNVVNDANDANLDEPFEIVFAEEPKPCARKKRPSHPNSLNPNSRSRSRNHPRNSNPNSGRIRKRKATQTSSSSPARRQR